MEKRTVRLSEKHVRKSVEMLDLAEMIKLKSRYLSIAYGKYMRQILKCIEMTRAQHPEREIVVVAGANWPVTFIVKLEEG